VAGAHLDLPTEEELTKLREQLDEQKHVPVMDENSDEVRNMLVPARILKPNMCIGAQLDLDELGNVYEAPLIALPGEIVDVSMWADIDAYTRQGHIELIRRQTVQHNAAQDERMDRLEAAVTSLAESVAAMVQSQNQSSQGGNSRQSNRSQGGK